MDKDRRTGSGRLLSLDALRGFDMFFIMGGENLLIALAAFLPVTLGSGLAEQMTHVPRVGLHIYDLVFPTFLFLAGVSWPFSYAKQVEKGATSWQIHRKILFRMLALILLGWIHDGILQFNWETQRLASVIGRIGIAWAVAALLYVHIGLRGQVAVFLSILIGYWALLYFVPFPGVQVPDGVNYMSDWKYCLCGWVDRNFLEICRPGKDGGAFATLGMPPTAMLGVFAGALLRRVDISGNRKVLLLLAGAVALVVLGAAWLPWCPCVKNIWNATFVCFAGAVSTALLAAFYWIIDVRGISGWSYAFRVIGMNSITIYMLQCFLGFRTMSKFFFGGVASLCDPAGSKLVLAAGYVLLCWLVLWFFERKKIFLKV